MPVTIHNITADKRHVTLRVEIAEKADYKLLNVLFQDVISERFGLRESLIPEPNSPDFDPSTFPLGVPFDLTFAATAKQVSLTEEPREQG